MTGKVPGCAIQTGQILAFARFSSASLRQAQNILVAVFNSACISSPTVSVKSLSILLLSRAHLHHQRLAQALDLRVIEYGNRVRLETARVCLGYLFFDKICIPSV